MTNNSKITWFLKEISSLKNDGIIEPETAGKLTEYYQGRLKPVNIQNIVFISLAILAGLLIFGGLVLIIIIYNLFIITKEIKTVGAFLLVLIPQVICFFVIWKKEHSRVLKEVFSLILALAFGFGIAFIGQIYQLPSDLERFLLIWSVATLIVMYLFESIACVPFYLTLIIWLASYSQLDETIGLIFYPLFFCLIPFYIMEYKKQNHMRVTLFHYFSAMALTAALGITMEKAVPGLWLIAYCNLFIIFYLMSVFLEKKHESLFFSPFKIAGVIGVGIFMYMISFHWPWEEIGWRFYRADLRFNSIASIFDYLVCVTFPLLSVFLAYIALRGKKEINIVIPIAGIVVITLYLLANFFQYIGKYVPAWIINLYIVVLFGYSLFIGYKNKSLLTINLALLLFFTTLISRFFDGEMSALTRGVAFIVTGVVILGTNLVLKKKFKRIDHE